MTAAGWYPHPTDPSLVLYWDGQEWVGTPVPKPTAGTPGSLPEASGADLIDKLASVVSDPRHQGSAMAVAGGAAVADGLVGIGKREGLGSALGGIVTGIAFILFTTVFFGFFEGAVAVKPVQPGETAVQVQVVDMEYTPRDSDGDSYCVPVVELEGERVTPKQPMYSSPCPVTVGESTDVYYVKGNTGTARFGESFAEDGMNIIGMIRWVFLGAGILAVIGGVFKLIGKLGLIAGGGLLIWKGLRRRNTAPGTGE